MHNVEIKIAAGARVLEINNENYKYNSIETIILISN